MIEITNSLHLLSTEMLITEICSVFSRIFSDKYVLESLIALIRKNNFSYITVITALKIYVRIVKKRKTFIEKNNNLKLQLKIEKENLDYNTNKVTESETNDVRMILYDNFLIASTCFLVAIKARCDASISNEIWHHITDLSIVDIGNAEKQILKIINFNVYFPGEDMVYREIDLVVNNSSFDDDSSAAGINKGIKNILERFCLLG